MRKIIFLDIDGVLATPENLDASNHWTFTPRCVEQLQRVLKLVPEAEIVLTSSWRKRTVEETQQHLLVEGLAADVVERLVGITIRGYEMLKPGVNLHIPRGMEIRQWIDHNVHSNGNGLYVPGQNGTYVRRNLGLDYVYVILDDDTDMLLEHHGRFVRCESSKGLTREKADQALVILGVRLGNGWPLDHGSHWTGMDG